MSLETEINRGFLDLKHCRKAIYRGDEILAKTFLKMTKDILDEYCASNTTTSLSLDYNKTLELYTDKFGEVKL